MKRFLAPAVLLALAFSVALAAAADAPKGPEALVAAETAFARDAAEHNVRDAFVRWLAPQSVVFNPGPVDAQKFYASKKPTSAKLAWTPLVAVMSGAGDLGWTTGPWWWRKDGSRKAADATGQFVTVWRRQADGAYRAVLDMGVGYPGPIGDPPPAQLRTLPGTRSKPGPLAERHALWKADADYARACGDRGRAAAIAAAGAEDVWLVREGHAPVRGRELVRDSLAAHAASERWVSTAQFISNSGDLGYTYGMVLAPRAAKTDTSYYLHLWQREAPKPWTLALELVSP